MRRRSFVLVLLWCPLALSGCQGSAPSSRDPVAGLRRVLGLDLSTHGFATSTQSLARAGEALVDEPGRAARLPAGVSRVADIAALPRAPVTAGRLLRAELRRSPTLPGRPWRPPDASSLRHDAANAARLLFGDDTPLDEIDDSRHRTDPLDDHPEASLWARLRRRLQLQD